MTALRRQAHGARGTARAKTCCLHHALLRLQQFNYYIVPSSNQWSVGKMRLCSRASVQHACRQHLAGAPGTTWAAGGL